MLTLKADEQHLCPPRRLEPGHPFHASVFLQPWHVWCLYSVWLRLAWPPHSILGSLLRRAATVTDAGATSNSAPVAQLCSRQLLSQGIEMQQVHGGLADLVYMLDIMEHSKPRRTQMRRLILEQCHHQQFSILVQRCLRCSIHSNHLSCTKHHATLHWRLLSTSVNMCTQRCIS
jgi:hypothetical protein